ncbi:hypothetical protein SCLCIDRAFT_439425 [Scleroderma citrinum Foug A]|uniref:Uncharacterized protein n=1 Tax=Scleroderma citrinum Foug A TaxID=1036808 RepID=A0A0C3CXR9_9AGAM|nr:hypothetical protein SCLCIDRAFT_439425 [Scleroderma citrinum Foug A]
MRPASVHQSARVPALQFFRVHAYPAVLDTVVQHQYRGGHEWVGAAEHQLRQGPLGVRSQVPAGGSTSRTGNRRAVIRGAVCDAFAWRFVSPPIPRLRPTG